MFAPASLEKSAKVASPQRALISPRHWGSAPRAATHLAQSEPPGNRDFAHAPFDRDFGNVPVHAAAGRDTRSRMQGDPEQAAGQGKAAARPSFTIKRFSVDSPTPGGGSPDKSFGEYSEFQDQSASSSTFAKTTAGVHIEVEAKDVAVSADYPDGFKWTQTIATNDPAGGTSSPYVDPRPNDDSKPFYYTDAEQAAHPTTFIDFPERPAPATGTTNWDATLCLNGVNEKTKTVTAFDALTYGFSRDTAGTITTRGPSSSSTGSHRSILSGEFPDWTFRGGLSRAAKTAIGVLGGAAVGAGIGLAAGGPIGAAVGAGVGAVVGGIGSLFF